MLCPGVNQTIVINNKTNNMASFGKKILSAFVEVTEEKKTVTVPEETKQHSTPGTTTCIDDTGITEKFKQYFDKLFNEANIPGPDYFEFSKMTEAMTSIPDENARFTAAFAGLSVQGLDKTRLLNTAAQYLEILEQDAASFNSTVDAALKEKVEARHLEIIQKQQRMEQLTTEINDLQKQVQLLQLEVKESEKKIESNTGGYVNSSEQMKQRILYDIGKIKQHIKQ